MVHGPLIATLLMDLLRRNRAGAVVNRYEFRAMKPLFDTASFSTCGLPDAQDGSAKLWTHDASGAVTMLANATYS